MVQFDLNRNIDAAASDIQSAINAASGQLPQNLPSPPIYRKVNPANSPIMILSVTSDAMSLTELDDNADTKLAQQISQLSGVGQVSIGGEQKPAIRIQLDPAKLYAKGLSLEDVRLPLSITTVNSPKGNIDGDKRSLTIYDNDQLINANSWNDVIVAYRNGAPLRVRDIGQAVPDLRMPRRRPGPMASAASSSSCSNSRAPTSSKPSTRSRSSSRACGPLCLPPSTSTS